MCRTIAALVFCLAAGELWGVEVDYTTVADWQSSYEFNTGDWQVNALTIQPEAITRFDGGARVTTKLLARWDAEDRLEPGEPGQPFRAGPSRRYFAGKRADFELREFFVDDYLGNVFIRAGRQQIVWGQADGLRVLDVLNPLSLREFILPDLEDRRIPLWSVQAEVPLAQWTLQGVWIPDSTVTEVPPPGSSFTLLDAPFAGTGQLRVERPEAFDQSDYGLRLGRYWQGWDLTFNYLFHTVDDPLITVNPEQRVVTASYNRSHLLGTTAAKAFGDYTLRLEAGYESKRRYAAGDGIHSTGEIGYVLGVDYAGMSDTLVSGQVFQNYREDPGPKSRTDETLTLLVRRDFMNQVWQLESLVIFGVEHEDAVWQLSADYQWSTHLRFNAGADVFTGDREGLYGRFRNRSRINIGASYSF